MRTLITKPTVTSTRNGAVLVVALICLLLLSVLAASLTRTVLLQREQVIREEWQLQAEWLAEAAIDRAVVRMESTPDYEGEEWRPVSNEGITLGIEDAAARKTLAEAKRYEMEQEAAGNIALSASVTPNIVKYIEAHSWNGSKATTILGADTKAL